MPAHRILATLGEYDDFGEQGVANLRAAFNASRAGKGVLIAANQAQRLPANPVRANLRYLDVAVALRLWRYWQLDALLQEVLVAGNSSVSPADVIATLVIQRCVEPGSKLSAQRWFPRTALPELLGIPPKRLNNTRIHRALEALENAEERLQQRLPRRYTTKEGNFLSLFLDVTDTWFVGRGPEIAEKAKTKEGLVRRCVGIVLLCNEQGYPLRWQVIPGKRPDGKAMTDMIRSIENLGWTTDAPLVSDRAMGKAAYVATLVDSDLHFLTAVPDNEFETYTRCEPADLLAAVELRGEDSSFEDDTCAAGTAAEKAGMEKIDEKTFVLDLGLLQPFSSSGNDSSIVGATVSKLRSCAELKLGRKMKADLESGQAASFSQLGSRYGCTKEMAARFVWLTELTAEVQDEILAGRAEDVSARELNRIRKLPAAEQRVAFESAIQAAATPGSRKRRRKAAGGRKSRRRKPNAAPMRGVLYFNPELFVQERQTAKRRLNEIETAVEDLNRRLTSPRSKRSQESILAEIGRLLSGYNLLRVFNVTLETHEKDGRKFLQVRLELDTQEWRTRQRYHGFNLLVGHAELRQSAPELVALYRAKDMVEKDFQLIKSVTEIRPVRHRTELKVRAHVTLCMLALLLERSLEKRLKEVGQYRTASSTLAELADCHLNQLELPGAEEIVYSVTRTTDEQRSILNALQWSDLAADEKVIDAISPR